jgi:hypothetical protein
LELSILTRYLRIPLRGGALGVIVVFALLFALALRGGIMGLPLGLIVLSWFFKYAFVLLDHVVDGGDDPPALAIEMMNPVSEQRSLVLLLIVVGIFFASNAASFWFGPVLGTLLGLVLVFILPAIVGVQGVTGSLLQSLDLHRCIRLIARLGRYYVMIVACAAVLLACAVIVAKTPAIPVVLRFAFDMYACLAVFAVIGGVLFERRLDIGLDAAYSPEREEGKVAADTDREHQHLLDRIYAEWRGGSHITACQTINELLQASASPADELEWLYAKTASWPDARLPNQLAQAWLPHLLAEKRHGRVLEVLRERLAADPGFRPATSTEVLRCVRLARDGGERRVARLLLEGFEQRFPGDALHGVATDLARELAR